MTAPRPQSRGVMRRAWARPWPSALCPSCRVRGTTLRTPRRGTPVLGAEGVPAVPSALPSRDRGPQPLLGAKAKCGSGRGAPRPAGSASSPPCHSRRQSFSPAPPADKPADDGPVFPRISPEPTPALDLGRGLCCAPGVSSLSPRGACLCRPVPRSAFVSADTGERTDAAHGREAP